MTVTASHTRSKLLDEAARRFLDEGYVETSLRAIADAMGIKAGSIYYHFASKEEILAEVLDRGIELISASVEEALVGASGSRERLERATRAHLTALFAHGAYTACHVRVFHQAPAEVQRRTTVARDRYEARWTELLAEAAADGVIRPEVDLTLARLFVLGALNASVEWFGEGGRTVDEVAAMFTALFLDGAAQGE